MFRSSSVINPRFVEVAPGLFLTPEGAWSVDPPPNAVIIAEPGLPPPDPGTKQMLLSYEQVTEKIGDELGLNDDQQKLLDTAVKFAALAVALYTGGGTALVATFFLDELVKAFYPQAAPGGEQMTDVLKALTEKVDNIDKNVGQILNLAFHGIKADLDTSINAVSSQASLFAYMKEKTEDEREILRVTLDGLKDKISGQISGEKWDTDVMKETYKSARYVPTPWYDAWKYNWGFQHVEWVSQVAGDQGIQVLGAGLKNGASAFYPYRVLGTLVHAIVTFVVGVAFWDPAHRTTGRYRLELAAFATVLDRIADKIRATLQITRPIDLASAPYKWFYGDWKTWSILRDGWPVGAVDTLTGASVFEHHWRPAEHGYPILELAPDKPAHVAQFEVVPPLGPFETAAKEAIQKANSQRYFAWLDLYANSSVPRLRDLAAAVRELATPPKESQTVAMVGPHWTGKRVSKGPIKEIVGDALWCELKSYVGEIYHVDRTAKVTVNVQPKLYQTPGANKIEYRFWLETFPEWTNASPTLPDPGLTIDRAPLIGNKNNLSIGVPTFTWNIDKVMEIGLKVEKEPIRFNLHSLPSIHPGVPRTQIAISQGGSHPIVEGPIPYNAEGPLLTINGEALSTGENVSLNLSFTRVEADGIVTFKIRNEAGQGNGVVWLVVEERVGNLLPSQERWIRTGTSLAMTGVEHHWPPQYLVHKKQCQASMEKMLNKSFTMAKQKGIPIPDPDPRKDKNEADFVSRIHKLVSRRR